LGFRGLPLEAGLQTSRTPPERLTALAAVVLLVSVAWARAGLIVEGA